MKYLLMLLTINTVAIMLALSGCTTTQTTSQIISDDTIKAMITAVDKLDKEQVKKLETAIKEKLKDESNTDIGSGQTSTVGSSSEKELHEVSPVVETGEGTKEEPNKTEDAFPLSDLTINVSLDSPQLIRHYTNGWTTEHPWGLIKDLPVTVTIKKFDASGIELDGVKQGKYENERWERTSTFWAFDENGNELGYEDNAAPNYPEPKRFYGIAKYILVVSCSDYDGFNATGRSRVTEVK